MALANEKELSAGDLLVTDIRVDDPEPSSDTLWESRDAGIWVLRSKFSGKIDQAVTEVDVLFGADAVDPRPQWTFMQSSLQLNANPKVPIARHTPREGQADIR